MYLPHSEKDKEEMLKATGASSFVDLIKQVPSKFLNPKYNIPEGMDEAQAARHLAGLAEKNRKVLNFVGAGAYERYTPAAVNAIIERGEFLTAYTPYQAESSQGTLQTIYEYQSCMCALYGMDCSNASMYDGASALAEAARAAVRVTGKKKIVYSGALNPQYVQVMKTYFANATDYEFVSCPLQNGKTNIENINRTVDEKTACFILQTPNFFGIIEDGEAIGAAVKAKGAMFVISADPVSLGILKTPGEMGADFATGEGQSLGLPLSYGGPYLGIFTCTKPLVRQMPGRIAGMTVDKDGKRGFVLTLQAREQHIRRDKAASNICSNEALCALSATIYTTLLGPEGMRELAETNSGAAHVAAEKLTAVPGVRRTFDGEFFNEFVITLPCDAEQLRRKILVKENIDIGLPLRQLFPGMNNELLVCATETKTMEDIDRLAKAVKENL